jgi:hypothetical protein
MTSRKAIGAMREYQTMVCMTTKLNSRAGPVNLTSRKRIVFRQWYTVQVSLSSPNLPAIRAIPSDLSCGLTWQFVENWKMVGWPVKRHLFLSYGFQSPSLPSCRHR